MTWTQRLSVLGPLDPSATAAAPPQRSPTPTAPIGGAPRMRRATMAPKAPAAKTAKDPSTERFFTSGLLRGGAYQ